MSGYLLLLVGILFLLKDRGVWFFFGLNWWTVLFLLAGLASIGKSCCKECKECCSTSCEPETKSVKRKR
jgi:hypothetical protein